MSAHPGYLWTDDVLLPNAGRTANVVHVTDSWLLSDGLVLALDLHRSRFLDSVAEAAPSRIDEAVAFWSAAMAEMPATGAWFPRLEYAELAEAAEATEPTEPTEPVFRLTLRPAPPRHDSVALITASHDPRLAPTVKGPDLARLDVLRTEAKTRGADEAVILSPDGTVVEGNYTSLVWWRQDALCVVADDRPRLPGITEKALVTLATALGVEILPDEVLPDELDGLEVWALNSLHGVRIATRWQDGPSLAESPGRLRLWRTRLDALRRSVA